MYKCYYMYEMCIQCFFFINRLLGLFSSWLGATSKNKTLYKENYIFFYNRSFLNPHMLSDVAENKPQRLEDMMNTNIYLQQEFTFSEFEFVVEKALNQHSLLLLAVWSVYHDNQRFSVSDLWLKCSCNTTQ